MMMEQREYNLDQELIGHLERVHFNRQQDFQQSHCWEELSGERFSNAQKDFGSVNGADVRNKGPSPCNSQASLGYHSLPSSQCGSRPSSNPDYIIDYDQSAMYLDSPLADSMDSCWRHNSSGQSMDISIKGMNQGQNDCKASIRKCIDIEWRQWCQQQQQNLKQKELSHTPHGYHSNGIQKLSGKYPKRTSTVRNNQLVERHQHVQTLQQNDHMHHCGYKNDASQQSSGRWIPNSQNHWRSSSSNCTSHHRQYYDEPHRQIQMLSKSLNTCSQFRTTLPTEDPIYEEIVEQDINRSNDTVCEETHGPNLPPRPKSWTSMVNLHQSRKAPVYYQIEQPSTSHQNHNSCSKVQSVRTKTDLSTSNTCRGVCANMSYATPADHYNIDDVSSINLPYFPHIHRLFQDDSEFSDNNSDCREKDSKTNEKKSGKRLEKFFGSLLNLNKSKAVKNMGTSTDEKTKDENNLERHRKLRRTVSESCNIYSKGKGNSFTYEDDMCNLLKEIKFNMKEIDHNSKKLHQNIGKDRKVKKSDMRTEKGGERRSSRREKKTEIKTEHGEGKHERRRSHGNARHQPASTPLPHNELRNSSLGLESAGVAHSVNHHAIKMVVNDNHPAESYSNQSIGSTHHRKSSHRPAMGVQALLTRASNYSLESNPNKSNGNLENNKDIVDTFERRLSHERTGSRMSFVYDYSEGSNSEESETEVVGTSGYASEAYAQGLASGEDNENWKEGDQIYGVALAKPLFRNNVVATAKRRKLIEKVTEL
ncbi:uncharacterized protein LOC117120051 [Anneissia japonica]|uniref:uncharacterized protein LOC117120051 n=1 Tax=Anneissia japonica TaxID=1529436 RepID=UPI0014255EDC|nr:uncharacterized protein LOC117120051 [Anneissia japonica]